jgi:hypothetical protein
LNDGIFSDYVMALIGNLELASGMGDDPGQITNR